MVADFRPETLDLVLVMQGRAGGARARPQNGLKLGDGRQRPYSPYLNGYVAQEGRGLTGRKLVGNCPPWRFGGSAQFFLQRGAVDLYHNTVDLVAQLIAL